MRQSAGTVECTAELCREKQAVANTSGQFEQASPIWPIQCKWTTPIGQLNSILLAEKQVNLLQIQEAASKSTVRCGWEMITVSYVQLVLPACVQLIMQEMKAVICQPFNHRQHTPSPARQFEHSRGCTSTCWIIYP